MFTGSCKTVQRGSMYWSPVSPHSNILHYCSMYFQNQDTDIATIIYGCENWTIKKAENQRIDAFELWCWRRLLTVPWTARRSNQSILKEINSEYSLEELVLKLKLQYFGHQM